MLLIGSDMGPLQLEVGLGHMKETSMVIGRAAVEDLTDLPDTRAVSG